MRYIDTGVIPKFTGCVNGVQWFKDRGQWMDGSADQVPGMIIFFDWDNKGSSGPQDGLSDHTGSFLQIGYIGPVAICAKKFFFIA